MDQQMTDDDHLADLLREQGATATEIAAWTRIAQRLADLPERQVTPAETERLLATLAPHLPIYSPVRQAQRARTAHRRGGIGWSLDLVTLARAQVSVLRLPFWIASAGITLLGAYIELSSKAGNSGLLLQALGPLLAFLGIRSAFRGAGLYTLEYELACPPSPMQLVVARLVVVLGYDSGLGLCLAAALWRSGNASFLAVTLHWLMPLLLVAGLALLLSLRLSSELAAGLAYAGWLGTLAFVTYGTHAQAAVMQSIELNLALGAVGLILLGIAACRFPADVPRLLPRAD
jgi:hypothetical protein